MTTISAVLFCCMVAFTLSWFVKRNPFFPLITMCHVFMLAIILLCRAMITLLMTIMSTLQAAGEHIPNELVQNYTKTGELFKIDKIQ